MGRLPTATTIGPSTPHCRHLRIRRRASRRPPLRAGSRCPLPAIRRSAGTRAPPKSRRTRDGPPRRARWPHGARDRPASWRRRSRRRPRGGGSRESERRAAASRPSWGRGGVRAKRRPHRPSGRGWSKDASRKRARPPKRARRSRALASMSPSTSINSTTACGAARRMASERAPVPPPRSRTRPGLHARDLFGGDFEHRFVLRDETPDGLVVGVDLNAEVAPDRMTAHEADCPIGSGGSAALVRQLRASGESRQAAPYGPP